MSLSIKDGKKMENHLLNGMRLDVSPLGTLIHFNKIIQWFCTMKLLLLPFLFCLVLHFYHAHCYKVISHFDEIQSFYLKLYFYHNKEKTNE